MVNFRLAPLGRGERATSDKRGTAPAENEGPAIPCNQVKSCCIGFRFRGSGVRISPSAPSPPLASFTPHHRPSPQRQRKPCKIKVSCIAGSRRSPSPTCGRRSAPLTVPRSGLESSQLKPPLSYRGTEVRISLAEANPCFRRERATSGRHPRRKPGSSPVLVNYQAAAGEPIAAFTRGMTSSATSCMERLASSGLTQSMPP